MLIYLTGFIWYNTKRFAAVAQLDRVPDSDSGGRGFESRQPYQQQASPQWDACCWYFRGGL